MPSKPNPSPSKKLPFSKTKTPVALIFLRLCIVLWVKFVLTQNTTHELRAFTIKHDFVQAMKKIYTVILDFYFEEI